MKLKYKILGIISGLLILIGLAILITPLPKAKDWDYSSVILSEEGEYLRVYLNKQEQWHLYYAGEIPEKLQTAILEFEDKSFYSHPGINPLAIGRALYSNLKQRKVVSGGSTITMQVARLFLQRERTLLNKIQEAFISLKLELYYSKDEILLMYLNNAPYGSNIIGIRSAAYKYYHKEIEQLTWAEASLFAVLPNNPGFLYPGSNTDKLKQKRDKLLATLKEKGYLDQNQYLNSIREEIPTKMYSFPCLAPHLADKLKNAQEFELTTTINIKLQKQLELIARQEGGVLASKGIKNLAILVSDTKTREVKAYLGSQDYFSNSSNGYIDGVQALRSSGSILKPFIYGYALEKGILTPTSLLEDTNKSYGVLLPKNYDRSYRGVVTVAEALQKSLNIPAYEVTQRLGVNNSVNVLQSVGMRSLFREPSDYGLSICIGGAEASLLELSEMYQTLAHSGKQSRLKLLASDELKETKSLLSPASCHQILEILSGVQKPTHYAKRFPNFSWKTGTSNGFRDAWAVGVDQQWTIAVWAGNFTGEGNPHLLGRDIAGNILFRVLSTLPENDSPPFVKPWADFKQIAVCAVSGFAPTKACSDTVWCDVPKSAFVLPKCSYHKQIIVDEFETMQLCSNCWSGFNHKSINILDYPPDVDYYLQKFGQEIPILPPHNPECSLVKNHSNLLIKYPISQSHIYLPTTSQGRLNSFQAEAFCNANTSIFWFLNKEFLAETKDKHTLDIYTTAGTKELLLVTSDGISKRVKFEILIKED
ncbi:MAG: penicillin-binding protein 1C [Candidatus Cloacimonadales bacterium]